MVNRPPTQSRLSTIQQQKFEQFAVIMERGSPFGIMVLKHQLIIPRPAAMVLHRISPFPCLRIYSSLTFPIYTVKNIIFPNDIHNFTKNATARSRKIDSMTRFPQNSVNIRLFMHLNTYRPHFLADPDCSGVHKIRFFSIFLHQLPSQHRLQAFDFFKDFIKQRSRYQYLCHLKCHITSVTYYFGSDFDKLFPHGSQRPIVYGLGQC